MTAAFTFGSWLKRRRRGLGLTQRELARQVGYAEVTLRKVEADELRPSHQMAEKLADALHITAEERADFLRFARDEPGAEQVLLPTQTLPPPSPAQLPVALTSFVGRTGELHDLQERLRREDVRLVTLTGTGGAGKTRLALEVAARLRDGLDDGVFFVDLSSVSDPALVAAEMAQVLGVRESAEQSKVESLKQWLRTKQTILLVNNFEHVTAAASLLTELLAVAPQLKILATSRERLHLYAEHEFPVPPLPLPILGALPPLTELARVPSVMLFQQRAQAAGPGFMLTPENASAVAALCILLDGLPLAIELAAARIKLFSPSALLARLTTGYEWLTGGARDLPARHQTLNRAIAWSYDLLEADEQALAARLAAFRCGCTLEAAAAVCASGLALPMLDGLASLLDKSLLVRLEEQEGDLRVGMLETIRTFAQERLRERGEEAETRRLHAAYYLELAEAAESELRGPRQVRWLARLDQEYDNLRAALAWLVEQGERSSGMRLAAALGWYWELRGHFSEGQGWLATLLAQVPREAHAGHDGLAVASALNVAGRLASRQGNLTASNAYLEKSLALAQALTDQHLGQHMGQRLGLRLQVLVLHSLGNNAATLGDHDLARMRHADGLQIAQALEDQWGMAWAHMGLGHVAIHHKDYAAARDHFAQSLALRRTLQDIWGIARSLNELGDVARYQEDFVEACALYEESLVIHRQLEHKGFLANVLRNLAYVYYRQGQHEQASALLRESLTLFQEQGRTLGMSWCMARLAQIAHAQGKSTWAVRLLAAATATFAAIGFRMDSVDSSELAESVSALQAQLGETAFAAAWALGRDLPIDETVAQAHHRVLI